MLRMPVAAIVVSISYFLSAKLALNLSFKPDYISTLWPPNGIILAALLLTAPRRWWWYILAMVPAELAADLPSGISLQMALAFLGADCIEVFTAAILLRIVFRGPLQFNNIKDVVFYAFYGVIIAPFIAAFFGAYVPALDGTDTAYIIRWRLWFMSDALTHLILTPTIFLWLTWDTGKKVDKTVSRTIEMIILILGILIISFFAFSSDILFTSHLPFLVYAPLPFLLWASVRFGLRGIFTLSLFFTVIMIWGASRGFGPFASDSPVNDVFNLQVFLFLALLPLILLATVIVERERGEYVVRESEKRFRLLANVAFDGITVTEKGLFLEVNEKFARIFNYSPSEIIGMHVSKIIASDYLEDAMEKIKLGYDRPYESVCLKKDGSRVPVEVYGKNFSYNDRTLRITAVQDITERRQAERERERLNKDLKIKNRELEQILYVTSHDLRSPLVNVEGYSNEMDHSLKELMSSIENDTDLSRIKEKIAPRVKKDILESLHYIQASVSKMETLIKGILKLSRLGRSEQKVEQIDMNEMMSNIMDTHRFRLNELNIKTEVTELPDCKGDSAQINQVFSNLLDNAIKYSDAERSCIIDISGHRDGNQSVYCMEDNGIGIAPEHQDKIFEIFHQLAPRRVKGEGMGLTIAHRIIEKHHGRIWVESEPGRGSRFFVSLPGE
jgi:PAS domain S-box-containing protein